MTTLMIGELKSPCIKRSVACFNIFIGLIIEYVDAITGVIDIPNKHIKKNS